MRAGLNSARLRLGLGSSSSEMLHLLLQNTQQHTAKMHGGRLGNPQLAAKGETTRVECSLCLIHGPTIMI